MDQIGEMVLQISIAHQAMPLIEEFDPEGFVIDDGAI